MHWTAALGALTCTAALFVRLASLMTLGVLAFGVAILENRHASSRLRSRVAFSGGRAQRTGPRAQAPSGIPARHCTAGPSGPDRLRWRPVFATSRHPSL